MSSVVRGFSYHDIGQNQAGKQLSTRVVNFAKAIPATATTGNLFGVTGVILVTGLFGVIATALAGATKPTLGVTGSNAAISAAPAAGFTGVAGNVIVMPLLPGGALPALVTSSGAAAASSVFVVQATNITITTDISNISGNITWILEYIPLYPKAGATVSAS